MPTVDPYWNNVVIALRMDGANNSTSFPDLKGHAVTPFGNARISTSLSVFGGASLFLDGSGDYLQIADAADLEFGASDFTIAFRLAFASRNPSLFYNVISKRAAPTSGNSFLMFAYNNRLYLTGSSTGGADTWGLDVPFNPALNTFSAVEVSRVGSVVYLFIDGVVAGSVNIGTQAIANTTTSIKIGAADNASTNFLNGYIDALQITIGVGRHSADYQVPTIVFGPGVAGTVRDDSGALCARTVRAYSRSSGALLAETISSAVVGSFHIATPDTSTVSLAVLDDASGSELDDLFFGRVVPANF